MFHDILESSWSYQEMVQKGVDQGLDIGLKQGLEQGLQKGLEQGELRTLRSVLVHFVEKRFPELLPLAQQAAQLNNSIVLNIAVDKLLGAQSNEQARQILDEINVSDNS